MEKRGQSQFPSQEGLALAKLWVRERRQRQTVGEGSSMCLPGPTPNKGVQAACRRSAICQKFRFRLISPDWIQDHIRRYLESNGADGHMWDLSGPGLVATLLLTTTGRKSGKPQILPLIYGKNENGYGIVASKGGAPSHPAWYFNLTAHPRSGGPG